MVGDEKKNVGATRRTLKNAILGNKYFRAFSEIFFVYHKLGSDME